MESLIISTRRILNLQRVIKEDQEERETPKKNVELIVIVTFKEILEMSSRQILQKVAYGMAIGRKVIINLEGKIRIIRPKTMKRKILKMKKRSCN